MNLPAASPTASEVYITDANVDWGSEALLLRHLDASGYFLDVGANIGYYALLAAPVVARVFAFEPDPRNWPTLEVNARLAGNVEVVRKAVWRETGTLALDVGGNSGISFLRPGGGDETVEAEVTTLDDFTTGLGGCAVTGIKIDVEGLDLDVLRGGLSLLRDHQPLVLTEFTLSEGRGNDPDALFALTEGAGYAVYAYVRRPVCGGQRFFLRSIDRRSFDATILKMLFLVPGRLQPSFAAEAGQ
jgi:FkbM family methyltransferase